MPDPLLLHVEPATEAMAGAVDALRVAPDQVAHVGDTAFNFRNALLDNRCDAMAIVITGRAMAGNPGASPLPAAGDRRVIGFYRLDYAPTIISRVPIDPATVGLRAFMIDIGWQGRGFGGRAIRACCEDLRLRHPERRLLALNVDCSNIAAIRSYRMAGFVDSGELYRGGKAGPQRLMLRAI